MKLTHIENLLANDRQAGSRAPMKLTSSPKTAAMWGSSLPVVCDRRYLPSKGGPRRLAKIADPRFIQTVTTAATGADIFR
jgi:hypothetical protein